MHEVHDDTHPITEYYDIWSEDYDLAYHFPVRVDFLKIKHSSDDEKNDTYKKNKMKSIHTRTERNGDDLHDSVSIYISYSLFLYESNAYGMEMMLRSLGYENVYIVNDFASFGGISTKKTNIQIVFGVDKHVTLLPNYIIFQSEQVHWSGLFTG